MIELKETHTLLVAICLLCSVIAIGCGDDSGGSGGTGGVANSCPEACAKQVECDGGSETVCAAVCATAIGAAGAISSTCLDSVNAVLACAGALSCTDYAAWQNEQPPNSFPCNAETMACDSNCNNLCDQEFDF